MFITRKSTDNSFFRRAMNLANPMDKADQLDLEAQRLDDDADRMEGTCWEGDMSPSQARRYEAAEKREHAMLLRLHMNK